MKVSQRRSLRPPARAARRGRLRPPTRGNRGAGGLDPWGRSPPWRARGGGTVPDGVITALGQPRAMSDVTCNRIVGMVI